MFVGQNSVATQTWYGKVDYLDAQEAGKWWMWGWEAIEGSFEQQRASLAAQRVKNLPAMQETWVWSLGWQDPLEKGMATHSSILAWRIPWTEEPGDLQAMRSQRVRHDWATHTHTHTHWMTMEVREYQSYHDYYYIFGIGDLKNNVLLRTQIYKPSILFEARVLK